MSFLFRSLPLSAKGQWLEPDAARTPERAVGQLPTEGEARLLHQGARRDGGELRRRVEHVEKKFHPVIFFSKRFNMLSSKLLFLTTSDK